MTGRQAWRPLFVLWEGTEGLIGCICVPDAGGLAELPDVADDSGPSADTYAPLAGGLTATAHALAAGAWKRRWAR